MLQDDLTFDAFLGGRLTLAQPRKGYRAGVDPVLLAASVPAQAGQSILELGCGTGAAFLCLAKRVPGLALVGVELQRDYADIAIINAAENNVDARVLHADIADMPADVRNTSFDHVIANPPYFDRSLGTRSRDERRNIAFGGETALSIWVDVAIRRLRPKGCLHFIQKADRLQDLLSALDDRVGEVTVTPITGRVGRDADRVLVNARKGSKAPFRLKSPLILHQGDIHLRDEDSYTPEIRAVLRDGAALG